MLQNLPNDIQESIVERLDVFDRAMVRMSCRSFEKKRCRAAERRLGVLARAVKRRAVSTATPAMLSFIESVPRCDPTHEILSTIVPERHPPESMQEGELCVLVRSARPEDIEGFLRNPTLSVPTSLKEVIFNMMLYNPTLFDHVASHRLLDVEQGREYAVYCCCSVEQIRVMNRAFSFSRDELQAMYVHCIDFMYTDPADYIHGLIKGT